MKKFMLRRIGVVGELTDARPSLRECIDAVIAQADTLMADVLEGLAAATSQNRAKRSLGNPAPVNKTFTMALLSQSPLITKTFVEELELAVRNSGLNDSVEQPMVRFEDLQLLDSDQIDASIEFALALQEVARCVDDVLPSLNALISSLLGWITVQPLLNPLKPDVFVRALQTSLKQHATDEQAHAAMIVPAAGLLGVSLRQLYREICDWLRSQGVEPASPLGMRLGTGGPGGNKTSENSVARTLVTLDKLRRLLSGEFDSGRDDSGMPDFSHTVPASFVALEDMKLVEPMMRRLALRASQSAKVAIKRVATGQTVAREATQGKQLGLQLGKEVVRMMLDNLMQDERLLPKVREAIKMLEPVLLVLAQGDPRFFSERQHPARQFLDRLTHRSLAFTSENDVGFARFFKLVSDAVNILKGSDGETAVFARVLCKLEDEWSVDDATQHQQHEDAARALLHAEQRNLLAQRLAEDFERRQEKKNIPELVAAFLRGPWAQVVAQSQLDCADGRADPDGYLALVDDLLWSVQLKLTRRNRKRLVYLIPNLLIKLRQGLQLIQYPEERIPVLFDALVSLHEKVFEGPRQHAGVKPSGADDQEAGRPEPEGGPTHVREVVDLADFWVADDEARDAGYIAEGAEAALEPIQRPWSVGDLNTGVWVELMIDGAWLRAQLVWASPQRTLFMFVSQGGLAHSMSRRTMDRLRRQGSIRLVSDGHVVDNALDAVVQTALQNDLGQVKRGS